MSEEKSIRLIAASTEFNVGRDHIIEFLTAKGYVVDNKPTTKLTEEMYTLLVKEYGKDKVLKEKADQLNIGIGRKIEKPLTEEEVVPAKKKEEAETTVVTKQPVIEEPIVEEIQPVKEEKNTPLPDTIETRKEKVEQPKVLGKIDLSERKTKKSEDNKKHPQPEENSLKETPKPEEPKQEKTTEILLEEVPQLIVAPIETVIEPIEQPLEIAPEKKKEADDDRMIERKKITLVGPKIMGKIEIKEEKKPEKKPYDNKAADNKKKKRKRIKKHEKISFEKIREDDKRQPLTQNKTPFENRNKKPEVDAEAAQRLIQEQIRNTLAKLSGNNQRGKASSKMRRQIKNQKREEAEVEKQEAAKTNILQVAEFTALSELASLMNMQPTDLIQTCFNLGMMVSINQRLDAEIMELLAEEFGYKIQFVNATSDGEAETDVVDDPTKLEHRAPIVTIMGHVDHGKTSLLDYIREANVVAGEKGGITQHIGAYEVMLANGKKIAFLDTPGHEAFTAMRARGAKITDIAVIVIAADDQVMPQTKEAISHAQAAGVPMVFAINKIDRPGANPEKIKEQLAQMNLLVEDWGGKFQSQEISAKSGLNVDSLLEKILLEAELLDLKANADKAATGAVIEASLDKGRGYVSNIMVQEGTLNVGDMIVAGPYYGKVKAMFNERNQKINHAGPSTPLLVLGLNGAPQAGEKFKIYADESEAKNIATKRSQIIREQGIRAKKHITLEEIGRRKALGTFKELNIIIKADVDGSAEALTDSLLKLSTPEIQVSVIFKGVGQITETDIMLASASDAVIVGFQVRPSSSVRKLAEKEGVEIRLYSIIYNAIEEVKAAMEGMLEPKVEEKVTCTVEVREVFKISKVGTIAGCQVIEGKITRQTRIRIVRDGIVIHTGNLASLKRFKDDVKEVTSGMECGLNINNFNDIQEGDIIEGFEEVEVKRTL